MANRRPLNPDEVADLFSTNKAAYVTYVDRCDKCHAAKRRYLEFGGESALEMPVIPDRELHEALTGLREALGRPNILLCYECTDDLEEPPGGHRFTKFQRNVSPVKAADELVPRLFED